MNLPRPSDAAALTFVPAGPAHATVLAALQASVFGRAVAGPTVLVWPAETWAAWLAGGEMVALIACAGDQPVGLAAGRVAADEGEILSLGVATPWRRHGVGRRLLDGLVAALAGRGAASLFLEVAADNRAALVLYTGAGFRAVGRRADYYRETERMVDALVLRRDNLPTGAG